MTMVIEYSSKGYYALVYQGFTITKKWKGPDGTVWARMEK